MDPSCQQRPWSLRLAAPPSLRDGQVDTVQPADSTETKGTPEPPRNPGQFRVLLGGAW